MKIVISSDIKINVGCGSDIRTGYLNCDYFMHNGVDLVFDLDKFPYPFDTKSIDYILASHVLEHLESPGNALREFHRILKSSGVLELRVPYGFNSLSVFHKQFFNEYSLDGVIYPYSIGNDSLQENFLFDEVKPVEILRYISIHIPFLRLFGKANYGIVDDSLSKRLKRPVNTKHTFGNRKELVWRLKRHDF